MVRGFIGRLTATLIVFCISATAAAAQQWVNLTVSDVHQRLLLDVESVAPVEDGIYQAWVRTDYPAPQMVPGQQVKYIRSIANWQVNCAQNTYSLGAMVLQSEANSNVYSTPEPFDRQWQPTLPGSAGEPVVNSVCALAKAESVDDIRLGGWVTIEGDSDNVARLLLDMDQIYEVQPGIVVVYTRADFPDYLHIDGVPFLYRVDGTLMDCERRQMATISQTFFLTPTLLVRHDEFPPADVQMVAIFPGSPAARNLERVCKADAIPLAGNEAPTQEASGPTALGTGTAWATEKGYLVTASHVIQGADYVVVLRDGEPLGQAAILINDPSNDVAILRFYPEDSSRPLRIIELAAQTPPLGRAVFTMGYPKPGVLGQQIKYTAGQVSSLAGLDNDARFLQVQIPLQPGNSGGPVVGDDGRAVGVASSVLTRLSEDESEPLPQLVNYAVKAAYIRPLLDDLPDLGNYRPVQASGEDEMLVQVREAVFMIVSVADR